MSRRPPYESPIPDFLQSENEEQARLAIGAASQEELDALEEAFNNLDIDGVNSKINQIETDVNNLETSVNGINNSITNINNELNQTIPAQRLMGNPGNTTVKPAPVDLDDGGLIITGGKIKVGDTYGKIIYWDASRSDGKDGKGTLSSPCNASTPARIDALMAPLYSSKTAVNLMLLPGADYRVNCVDIMNVYPVAPSNFHPWYLYNGLRIKGFGKGRTIIKPAVNTHHSSNTKCRFSIFRSSFLPEDGEYMFYGGIEDLTIDGEVTTYALPGSDSAAYTAAYDCAGDEVIVRNIHFTRLGGRGQEMFPVILRNGLKVLSTIYIPERHGSFLMEGCSSKEMYHDGAGIGFLINGSHERASNIRKRVLFHSNLGIEDCYITWADWDNFEARYNRMSTSPGKGIYAHFNGDTGINRGVKIIGNDCYGCIGNGLATGCVTMGNWLSKTLGVLYSDILIRDNTFRMFPNLQARYNPGVVFNGNVRNWNISDNFYEQGYTATHFSRRGFVSNAGTGNAANPTPDGTGWGNPWNLTKSADNTCPALSGSSCEPVIPDGGPQEVNTPGIMFNNKLIDRDVDGNYTVDHGKTPDGMDNSLMSAIV